LLKPSSRKDDEIKRRIESSISSALEKTLSRDRWKSKLQLLVADKLVKSIGQSKGLPMKVVQLASYAELRLPQEVRDLLAELQTMSAPMAPGVSARVFFEEFGKRPDEVFAEWDAQPFAAASIGQV